MTETQTKPTREFLARKLYNDHLALDAAKKAGRYVEAQRTWMRSQLVSLEVMNRMFVRRTEGEALAMVSLAGKGQEEWLVGQHCDSGLFYAWPRAEGAPSDVANEDPDGVGGDPFVNVISAWAVA